MRKALIVFLIFSFSNDIFGQENLFLEYYKKTSTAVFYSSTYLNSYHDIQFAKKYLDSTKNAFKLIDKSNDNYQKYLYDLSTIENEIISFESISSENINYHIPHFSLFAGYRDDYVNLQDDDPEEILIESLISKQLNQQDPILRGTLGDNTQFILLTISPFDDIHHGTAIDLINSTTSHYSIRPHEISRILGKEGYNNFINNSLANNDWKKLLDYYQTDKIYNFHIRDNGSIRDHEIFYKGITFNIITDQESSPSFVRYFESFKISKSRSFYNTLFNLLIIFALFIALIFIGKEKLRSIKNQFLLNENLISNLIISIIAIITTVILSPYILSLFTPEINTYLSNSYFWIVSKVMIPIFISIGLIFPLHLKLSKVSTSSEKNIQRIIFASICSPIILNVFYVNYSKIDSVLFELDIFSVFTLIGFYIPSRAISLMIFKIIRRINRSLLFTFLTVVTLIIYTIVLFQYELNSSLLYYYIIGLNIFAIVSLNFSDKKEKSKINLESSLGRFLNPLQYIKTGFNYNEVESELNKFINNSNDLVFFINGDDGIGKTRFIKNYIEENSKQYEFFYGDFNEFNDGAQKMYEPFYQAFCESSFKRFDKDNNIFLDPEFFSDRSTTFNTLSKVTKTALDTAPINLGELITVDNNDSISVNEISNELVDLLISEINERCVIVLDDYQWVDKATNELLVSLINKAKSRGKKTSTFKIIIITSDNIIDEESYYKECIEEVIKNISGKHLSINLKINNNEEFLNTLFNTNGYKYFNNDLIYFTKNLKDHLTQTIQESKTFINPKNLFSYLQSLHNNNIIGTDGLNIRLNKIPDEDFLYEDSSNHLMKSKFQKLSEQQQKLIESASHIGFKFDATILSFIWKRDFIEIINELEKIESFGLIEDNLDQDNIFEFTSKTFHKWLRSNFNNENKEVFNQRIIEIQKRIIESVESNGEEYVKNLDIDVLKSISNRCNKFRNVDGILSHSLKFNLITSFRLSKINKISQSTYYLERIEKDLFSLNEKEIELLIQTLDNHMSFDDNFNKIDSVKSNSLFDIIFSVLLKNTNLIQRSRSMLLFMLDLSRRKNQYKNKDIYSKRRDKVLESKIFIQEKDMIRFDFYNTLLEDEKNKIVLNNLKKSSISRSDFILTSEILRELIELNKIDKDLDNMYRCMYSCLMIEKNSDDHSKLELDHFDNDFKSIKTTIKSILLNTSIKHKKAKILSFLLSRFAEYYYYKKEFTNCVWICKNAKDLNDNIGNYSELATTYSIQGAAYLRLNEIESAEEIFRDLYELLIKSSYQKESFLSVFEGLLYCAIKKKDFSTYERLKSDFYEHLMYISFNMRNKIMIESIIDDKKRLIDLEKLIPNQSKKPVKISQVNLNLAKKIFKLLYLISKVDGKIDEKELYDLGESVSAVTLSLGLNIKIEEKEIQKIIASTNKLDNSQKIKIEFEKTLSNLTDNNVYDPALLKSINNFIYDISIADGKIDKKEKELINIANRYLIYENY